MLPIKYTFFAIISIFFNLLLQVLSLFLYKGFGSLYIAMILGTISGFVVKYILDTNYIFYYKANSIRRKAKNIFMYSLTGIFTTMIFWGVEILFDIIFNHSLAKFIGAFIGLVIGYFLKYFFDKNYVFLNKEELGI